MTRDQLEHLLRAAGAIVQDTQIYVIGSQSLHGMHPNLPDQLVASIEADLIAKNRPAATERLNAIGVGSHFHITYGYYADPVDLTTARLPRQWKSRLVNLVSPETGGVTGLCLDPHDLALAKYFARREKDMEFTKQMVAHGILDEAKLIKLLATMPVSPEVRTRIASNIAKDFC